MLPYFYWILPVLLIVSGFFIGKCTENIILSRIQKIVAKTKSEYDELVIQSLRGMPFLWSTMVGIYGAALSIPLNLEYLQVINKFLLVLFLFSVTLVAARLAVSVVNAYAKKTEGLFPATSIFANFTQLVIFLMGFLFILQSLGISITPILTALGVGGLAVALALQETLSNLFCGLHILVSRPIKPGDYVKIDTGDEGYVTDITWRSTIIKALPDHLIVVPNSRLASAIITNYFLPEKEIAVLVNIGISYDADLEKAELVTLDIAKQVLHDVPGGVPNFEPLIRYLNFGESCINMVVVLRVKEYIAQYPIKHEFIKRIHKRYREEGIDIPYPTRSIQIKH